MPVVTFPNGDSITFPDGMSEEEMRRLADQHWASVSGGAPGAQPPGPAEAAAPAPPGIEQFMADRGIGSLTAAQGAATDLDRAISGVSPAPPPQWGGVFGDQPGKYALEALGELAYQTHGRARAEPGELGSDVLDVISAPSHGFQRGMSPDRYGGPIPEGTAPLAASLEKGVADVVGMVRSGLGSAATPGEIPGVEVDPVQQLFAEWAASQKEAGQAARENASEIGVYGPETIFDAQSGDQFVHWLGRTFAEQAPILGGLMVTGAVGGPGAVIPAGMILETGSITQDQIEMWGKDDPMAAQVGGVVAGALEALPIMQWLSRTSAGSTASQWIAGKALAVLSQMGTEATTEYAQTLVEALAAQFVAENKDKFSDNEWQFAWNIVKEKQKEAISAAAAGAAVGGGMGMVEGQGGEAPPQRPTTPFVPRPEDVWLPGEPLPQPQQPAAPQEAQPVEPVEAEGGPPVGEFVPTEPTESAEPTELDTVIEFLNQQGRTEEANVLTRWQNYEDMTAEDYQVIEDLQREIGPLQQAEQAPVQLPEAEAPPLDRRRAAEEQLARLDARLGVGVGAVKERAKLQRVIEENTPVELPEGEALELPEGEALPQPPPIPQAIEGVKGEQRKAAAQVETRDERSRVLEAAQAGTETAKEIADQLGISVSKARVHLNSLAEEGELQKIPNQGAKTPTRYVVQGEKPQAQKEKEARNLKKPENLERVIGEAIEEGAVTLDEIHASLKKLYKYKGDKRQLSAVLRRMVNEDKATRTQEGSAYRYGPPPTVAEMAQEEAETLGRPKEPLATNAGALAAGDVFDMPSMQIQGGTVTNVEVGERGQRSITYTTPEGETETAVVGPRVKASVTNAAPQRVGELAGQAARREAARQRRLETQKAREGQQRPSTKTAKPLRGRAKEMADRYMRLLNEAQTPEEAEAIATRWREEPSRPWWINFEREAAIRKRNLKAQEAERLAVGEEPAAEEAAPEAEAQEPTKKRRTRGKRAGKKAAARTKQEAKAEPELDETEQEVLQAIEAGENTTSKIEAYAGIPAGKVRRAFSTLKAKGLIKTTMEKREEGPGERQVASLVPEAEREQARTEAKEERAAEREEAKKAKEESEEEEVESEEEIKKRLKDVVGDTVFAVTPEGWTRIETGTDTNERAGIRVRDLKRAFPGWKFEIFPDGWIEMKKKGGPRLAIRFSEDLGKEYIEALGFDKFVTTVAKFYGEKEADVRRRYEGTDVQIAGSYTPSLNLTYPHLISLTRALAGPETLFHEAFHFFFRNFLTPTQRKKLIEHYGTEEKAARAYGAMAAEHFAKRDAMNAAQRILAEIWDFVVELVRMATKRGQNPAELMERLYKGGLRNQPWLGIAAKQSPADPGGYLRAFPRRAVTPRYLRIAAEVAGAVIFEESLAENGIDPSEAYSWIQSQSQPAPGQAPLHRLMYSGVRRALERSKERKRKGGEHFWKWLLRQPNVTVEELEWSGLRELIFSREQLTMDEVLDFLDQGHGIVLYENWRGEDLSDLPITREQRRELEKKYNEAEREYGEAQGRFANAKDSLIGALESIYKRAGDEAVIPPLVTADLNTILTATPGGRSWSEAYARFEELYYEYPDVTSSLYFLMEAQDDQAAAYERVAEARRDRDSARRMEMIRSATIKHTSFGQPPFTLTENPPGYVEGLMQLPERTIDFVPQVRTNYTIEETDNGRFKILDPEGKDTGVSLNSRREAEAAVLEIIKGRTSRLVRRLNELANYSKEVHWGSQKNVVVHVRMASYPGVNGERVLFIEEVQSDWHQEAVRDGYRKLAPDKRGLTAETVSVEEALKGKDEDTASAAFSAKSYGADELHIIKDPKTGTIISWRWNMTQEDALAEQEASLLDEQLDSSAWWQKVPDAPFKGNRWVELALKRILIYAAENDYDRIAWTTGRQQTIRATDPEDGRGIVQRLVITQEGLGRHGKEPLYRMKGYVKEVPPHLAHLSFPKTEAGEFELINASGLTEEMLKKKLEKVYFDSAMRQLKEDWRAKSEAVFEGKEIIVDGQGMIAHYDERMPSTLAKLTRKRGKFQRMGIVAGGQELQQPGIKLDDKIIADIMSHGYAFEVVDPTPVKTEEAARAALNERPRLQVPPVVQDNNDEATLRENRNWIRRKLDFWMRGGTIRFKATGFPWPQFRGSASKAQMETWKEAVGLAHGFFKEAEADLKTFRDIMKSLARNKEKRIILGTVISHYLAGQISKEGMFDIVPKSAIPDWAMKQIDEMRDKNTARHEKLLNSGLLPPSVEALLRTQEFYLRRAYQRFLQRDSLIGRWKRHNPSEADLKEATDLIAKSYAKEVRKIANQFHELQKEVPEGFDYVEFFNSYSNETVKGLPPELAQRLLGMRNQVQKMERALTVANAVTGKRAVIVEIADGVRDMAAQTVKELLSDEDLTNWGRRSQLNVMNLQKRVLGEVFRRLYGEITDPAVLQALTVEAQGTLLSQAFFFQEMLKHGKDLVWSVKQNSELGLTEQLGTLGKDGYPDEQSVFKYGLLAGKYVAREFKDFLELKGLHRAGIRDLYDLSTVSPENVAGLVGKIFAKAQALMRTMLLSTVGAFIRNYMTSYLGFAMQSGDWFYGGFQKRFIKYTGRGIAVLFGKPAALKEMAEDIKKGAFRYSQASIVTDLAPILSELASSVRKESPGGVDTALAAYYKIKSWPQKLKEAYVLVDYAAKKAAWETRYEKAMKKAKVGENGKDEKGRTREEIAETYATEHVSKFYQNADKVPEFINAASRLGLTDFGGFKYDSGRMAVNAAVNVFVCLAARAPSPEGSRLAEWKGITNNHPELLDTYEALSGFMGARVAGLGLYGPGQYLFLFRVGKGVSLVAASFLAAIGFEDDEPEKKEVPEELTASINSVLQSYDANAPRWEYLKETKDGKKAIMLWFLGNQFPNVSEEVVLGLLQRMSMGGESAEQIIEDFLEPSNVSEFFPLGVMYSSIIELFTGYDPQTQTKGPGLTEAAEKFANGSYAEATDAAKAAFGDLLTDMFGGAGRSVKKAQQIARQAGREPQPGVYGEEPPENTMEAAWEIAKPFIRVLRGRELDKNELGRIIPYHFSGLVDRLGDAKYRAGTVERKTLELGAATAEEIAISKEADDVRIATLYEMEAKIQRMKPLAEYLEMTDQEIVGALTSKNVGGGALSRKEAMAIVYGEVDTYLASPDAWKPDPKVTPDRSGDTTMRMLIWEGTNMSPRTIHMYLQQRDFEVEEDYIKWLNNHYMPAKAEFIKARNAGYK